MFRQLNFAVDCIDFRDDFIRQQRRMLLQPRVERKLETTKKDCMDPLSDDEGVNSPDPDEIIVVNSDEEEGQDGSAMKKLRFKIGRENSLNLKKCYKQCYKNKSHQLKHQFDFSSPLGFLLSQKDKVDEEYLKTSLSKLDSLCSTSIDGYERKPCSYKKGKKRSHFCKDSPVLEEMRQRNRELSL